MLKVENLTIRFEDREAGQEVVKGISFSVNVPSFKSRSA